MEALAIDVWDLDARRRTERLQWQVTREILVLGGTAIIDWGTWGRNERDELRLGARSLGAAVHLIYLTQTPETLHERISRRGRENPPITLDMLREWSAAIEVPTADEITLYDALTEPLP
jgi:predicted kinase